MSRILRQAAQLTALIAMVAGPALAETSNDKVEAAITTIPALDRPGRDNLATVWDGNKYIQCRRMSDRSLRCEAAGALMQISLGARADAGPHRPLDGDGVDARSCLRQLRS